MPKQAHPMKTEGNHTQRPSKEGKAGKVSLAVVRRLPRYYRYLHELWQKGVERVSSRQLAGQLSLTASQIRQDFNCFGGFGQQGYGYNVKSLMDNMADIIGIDKGYRGILIGVGNLGRALCNNFDFAAAGIQLDALFESAPVLIGQTIGRWPVRPVEQLEDYVRVHRTDVAVLTLSGGGVSAVVTQLVELGVKGFWNFSNVDLPLAHPDVKVENVHLSDSLMTLCYQVGEEGAS